MPYKYAEDYKVSTAIESTPACVGTNKGLESTEIEKIQIQGCFWSSSDLFKANWKIDKKILHLFSHNMFGNLCLYI